jgi:hypothetical protein
MPEQYTDAQGAPIAPENLATALQSGEAYGLPDADYTLKTAGGEIVKVKGAEIPKALGSGYSIVPPDVADIEARRHELESAPVATAIERLGSAVTLGGLDWAARTFDPQFADDMAARAQANQGAAAAGEVAGYLAPNKAVSGVAGLVGKALKGAETTTAAGRMALRAAQGAGTGALEGALYGAGSEVSSASLQNHELTAEKLLSGAGKGAAIGGLLGGLGGAISGKLDDLSTARREASEGVDSLLAKKTEALTAKLRADGVAESRIAEQVAKETAALSKKTNKIQEFANAQAMRTLEPNARMLRERAERAGSSVDDLIQQAGQDYLGYEMKTGPMAGKRIFHGAKNPIDVIDDVGQALKETRAQVGHFEEMAERSAMSRPEFLPDAAAVQSNLNSILSTGRKPTALAREVASDIAPVLIAEGKVGIRDLRAASDAIAARIEGTTSKPQIRTLSEVKRVLDDSAGRATRDALQSAGIDVSKYGEAQRVHRSLSLVHDAIAEMKLDVKRAGKADNGLPGYAMAATLLGSFPQSLAAGATLLVSKFARERAGGIAAEVAHRVASSDVRIGWGAKAIAGDAWSAAKRTANASVSAAPLIQRVQEITSTPDGAALFAAKQIEEVGKQYPDLASAMSMKIIGDLQYLAAHAPAPVGRGLSTMTPTAAKSSFPPRAAAEWFERAQALQDPGIVVDEVLKGRVPAAAIQAMKDRRPLLWEKMRSDVAREVALRSEELPFKRRITIGLAFEFQADKSLAPGMVRSIQTSSFPPPESAAPNGIPTGGPGRPAAATAPDMASMQSMTQQIGSGV